MRPNLEETSLNVCNKNFIYENPKGFKLVRNKCGHKLNTKCTVYKL